MLSGNSISKPVGIIANVFLASFKAMRFDIVVSFDAKDRNAVMKEACNKVQSEFPGYTLQVAMDTDFSEEE